jgi:hypothetical protein
MQQDYFSEYKYKIIDMEWHESAKVWRYKLLHKDGCFTYSNEDSIKIDKTFDRMRKLEDLDDKAEI